MRKLRVFVSHAGTDAKWVNAFAQALRSLGAEVSLDDWNIQASDRMLDTLEEALRGSDAIAFVVTPESADGPTLFFELGAAIGLRKRAVPILPRGLKRSQLPYPLRVRKALTRGTPDETAKQFLDAMAA